MPWTKVSFYLTNSLTKTFLNSTPAVIKCWPMANHIELFFIASKYFYVILLSIIFSMRNKHSSLTYRIYRIGYWTIKLGPSWNLKFFHLSRTWQTNNKSFSFRSSLNGKEIFFAKRIRIGGFNLESGNLENGYLEFNHETRFWVAISSTITWPPHTPPPIQPPLPHTHNPRREG
jgi:hypothetical protein